MREGSTLIEGLLPDYGRMVTEQPKVLPRHSEANALFEIGLLVVITLGFDMFLDNVAVFAFFMMVSLRWLRLSIGLVLCLFIHREVPTFVIAPTALGLLLYQSVLFTRHWVYIETATISPGDAREIRGRLGPALRRSLILLPLTLCRGAFRLARSPHVVWRAWVSYLNYGKDGLNIPGIFHSPAGPYVFRLHLFYAVGAAITLSFGAMPVPLIGVSMFDPVTMALLSLLCAVPALVSVVVPALILAPYLGNLRRIRRESDL